jgi:hypothetical protein
VKVRRRGADEKADYMQMARVPCGYIYPPPQEQDWAVRPKKPADSIRIPEVREGSAGLHKRSHQYCTAVSSGTAAIMEFALWRWWEGDRSSDQMPPKGALHLPVPNFSDFGPGSGSGSRFSFWRRTAQ